MRRSTAASIAFLATAFMTGSIGNTVVLGAVLARYHTSL